MKKILLCVAIVSIVLFGYTTYAEEELSTTDTLVADIIKNMQTLSPIEQIKRLESYEKIISNIEIDEKSKDALLLYIEQKKSEANKKIEQSKPVIKSIQLSNTNTEKAEKPTQEYETLANTNREEIAKYRSSLHNEERAKKGLSLFVYNKNLERSAYTRSNSIVELGRTSNFHKRNTSDWYYSYDSIKSWFANLGIVFNGEWTEFSENVWRGYYKCKDTDCTEAIKKAISSTWKFFIKEASRNGPHYRAIVMPQYTKMGLGITLDPKTKKYFLVTHYSK